MKKFDQIDPKLVGSFLVLLFLSTALIITVRYLPKQRVIQPRATAPDLAISSISLRPTRSPIREGDQINATVHWVIDKYGGSQSLTFEIALFRDNAHLENVIIGSASCLSPYTSCSSGTDFTFTAPAPGSYTVLALGDRNNLISESWEHNNSATVSYVVQPPSPPPCSDECSPSGARQCAGSAAYQTCGNYDADSCLEWSAATSCPAGQTCSGSGVCSTSEGGTSDGGTSGGGTSGGGTSGGGTSGGKKTGGGTGSTNPTYLETLQLQVSIPYLVGEMKIPVKIGSLSKDILVSPDKKDYSLDVKEVRVPVGSSTTIVAGGNKTLLKKTEIKVESASQSAQIGDLILGDLKSNNIIDSNDEVALFNSLTNQTLQGDLNADGVTNSLDWAILLINFGKKGDT